MSQIEAAQSTDVTEGAVFAVTLAGKSVGLTRVGGAVQAFANKCPHMGLKLTRGKIENGTITCPFHGSKFDLCTGKDVNWANSVLGLPMPSFLHGLLAMGKTPHGLTKLAVSEADGKVFVQF